MHKERFIPVLQIQNRHLVKTIRFTPSRYLGDPLNAIRVFNLKGVSELIVTDISATKNKVIDFDLLEKISAQAFVPIAYGGGVSSIEDAHKLYQIGFDKIIINTALFEQPKLIKKIADIYGSQNVIGSIDFRKNHGNTMTTYYGSVKNVSNENLKEIIDSLINSGVGEIFLHDVERDGTYKGLDLDVIRYVSKLCPVPVIACGGAKSLNDMDSAINSGASAIAAGSLFSFYGKHKAVLINYGGIC
jgi:imidazole glycerol-phosphate synthase subunit HisF